MGSLPLQTIAKTLQHFHLFLRPILKVM